MFCQWLWQPLRVKPGWSPLQTWAVLRLLVPRKVRTVQMPKVRVCKESRKRFREISETVPLSTGSQGVMVCSTWSSCGLYSRLSTNWLWFSEVSNKLNELSWTDKTGPGFERTSELQTPSRHERCRDIWRRYKLAFDWLAGPINILSVALTATSVCFRHFSEPFPRFLATTNSLTAQAVSWHFGIRSGIRTHARIRGPESAAYHNTLWPGRQRNCFRHFLEPFPRFLGNPNRGHFSEQLPRWQDWVLREHLSYKLPHGTRGSLETLTLGFSPFRRLGFPTNLGNGSELHTITPCDPVDNGTVSDISRNRFRDFLETLTLGISRILALPTFWHNGAEPLWTSEIRFDGEAYFVSGGYFSTTTMSLRNTWRNDGSWRIDGGLINLVVVVVTVW